MIRPFLSEAIYRIIADPNININFRAAIVPHYAPCHHNAIGPCALCQGPCESCGAQYEDGKAKHFPVSPRRDKDGHLECAECLLPAGHLEVEPVLDMAFFDYYGRAVSGRFYRDGEL